MDIDDEMVSQFLDYVGQAIGEMKSHIDAAKAANAASPNEVDSIYGVAHNLKGMGVTFGYDLLTEVGALCCEYIKSLPSPTKANVDLLSDFHKIFDMIYQHRINGDGGDKGKAIVTRMREKIINAP